MLETVTNVKATEPQESDSPFRDDNVDENI
jgi:hypothetical protein